MRTFRLPFLFLAAASSGLLAAQEICANGIDDDGDGLIDLNDVTDCRCNGLTGQVIASLIPNPGFEEHTCFPTNFSELNCADTWQQATVPTSDYFWLGTYFPSFIDLPLPDGGNGCVGGYCAVGYKEYPGTCLLEPLEAGSSYRLSFGIVGLRSNLSDSFPQAYTPVDVTLWGYGDCPTWPLTTDDCPEPLGWTALGSVSYTLHGTWSMVSITFTPAEDIRAVMIGPPCDLPPDYPLGSDPNPLPYLLYDKLILNATDLFEPPITTYTDPCTFELELIGTMDPPAIAAQWYLDGVAIPGATDDTLAVGVLGLGPGLYQFRSSAANGDCVISELQVDAPASEGPTINGPFSGCVPLAPAFTCSIDPADVAAWSWDFGDDTPASTEATPTHTYEAAGTYDVTLTVTADVGCTLVLPFADHVTVLPLPVPTFTTDTNEGCLGLTVQFTNTTPDANAGCLWTFGDGGFADGCAPQHTYATAGNLDVQLTVTDANGCTGTAVFEDAIHIHPDPTVDIDADVREGCVPLTVQFINTTPPEQVADVLWDLAVGTSTDPAPVAVYEAPGTYTIALAVTDDLGCTGDSTFAAFITVHALPEPVFTWAPDTGCAPLPVIVTNTTDPAMTASCLWDFGDGVIGGGCELEHSYTEAGTYAVRLRVTSPDGCVGDTIQEAAVTVLETPVAAFTFGPQPTDLFEPSITFTNTSSPDAFTWAWDFGPDADPTTSGAASPFVEYPLEVAGLYPVILVVTDADGCSDTARATVRIDGHFSVYAPTAFTPNGDGVNDRWAPVLSDLDPAVFELSVFDRWGREIWKGGVDAIGWDGRAGSADPVMGIYTWKLHARDATSRTDKAFTGHVAVLP